MKNNKKKIIIITIIVAILIILTILGVIFYLNAAKQKREQETPNEEINLNDMMTTDNVEFIGKDKKNTAEKVLQERIYEGIKIKDISLVAVNGVTTFKATVENTTNQVNDRKVLKLIFMDQLGVEWSTPLEIVLEPMQPGESKKIETRITSDISNSSDYRIETKEILK